MVTVAPSRISVISIDQLPPMQVLETISTEAILTARMAKLVELWAANDPPNAAQYDVGNLEFDPLRVNQELSTFFELMLRDRVNQAARSVTLAYAVGGDLDAIGSRYPGGLPRFAGENDDRYRRRVWLAANTLGPHGTAEAYEFWALTALNGVLRDARTVKMRASLNENPIIVIACLADGADPRPTTAQLLEVRKYIQSEARQGMTDVISVSAAKIIETTYQVGLWLFPGPDKDQMVLAVANALAALVESQRWLGYDHMRDAAIKACMLPGVHHVDLISPVADITVANDWFVKVNSIQVTYSGTAE